MPTKNKPTWQQVRAHTQFLTENRARYYERAPHSLHATFYSPLYIYIYVYIQYVYINPNVDLQKKTVLLLLHSSLHIPKLLFSLLLSVMAEDFSRAVDDGLKLSKRIYFGKDRAVAPPKPPPPMARSATAFLPTAPMVYAVICDPGIVDNPDIPSYQPHVHGRCDPPALIPLQMTAIEMEADCHHDTAFITVSGSWRLHCVKGSRACDCRVAVPMGLQVLSYTIREVYFVWF